MAHDDTHASKHDLYKRDILAVNGSVVYDHENLGVHDTDRTSHVAVNGWTDEEGKNVFAEKTVRALLGRGPD
jgi:hypothetical protein